MDLITFSYSYSIVGRLQAFSLIDLLLSFIWISVAVLGLYLYKNTKTESDYKHFISFFLFKVMMMMGFTILYVYSYGGGDSIAFWSTSNSLVDLSFKDFGGFLNEMFGLNSNESNINEFVKNGIRYPSWIVRESEGYFISKITWFFNFISGKNYLLTSLYFTLFSFLAQWRLYLLIKTHFITNPDSKFYLLFLFIPSVAFWCTGISKDTIVLIGILSVVYYLIKWFVLKERKPMYIFWLFLYSILLIKTRDIAFVVVVISFFIAWLFTLVNRIEQGVTRSLLRFGLAILGFGMVMAGFLFFGLDSLMNEYLNEASVIQTDFATNSTYTGKGYTIAITDFSVGGMLLASPFAILTGLFRPGIWEALSPTLILNGLESTVLIFLSLKNIVFRWGSFSKQIFGNFPLLFAVVFVILFAFITGLTSVIFGVLVRLRTPLLIFFALVLYWRDLQPKPIDADTSTTK